MQGEHVEPAHGQSDTPPGGGGQQNVGQTEGGQQNVGQTGGGQQNPAQTGGGQQPQPIAEMTVSTPTLQRVTMDHPQMQLPLGPDDHVLNTVYNPQIDAWEVLVIVQPDEEDDEE